jgi:membrane-bound ClpP family serine protease
MLFDPAGDAYQVSLPVALAISGTLVLLFGFALTKAARVRRMPPAVGAHRLIGEPGEVRSDDLVFVDGELWQARSANAEPLEPGEHVVVESVDPEGLHLVVVGSPQTAPPIPAERT